MSASNILNSTTNPDLLTQMREMLDSSDRLGADPAGARRTVDDDPVVIGRQPPCLLQQHASIAGMLHLQVEVPLTPALRPVLGTALGVGV